MAQSGGLEGFIKDLGAEGAAMLCATGRFIAFPICFLLGNFWGKAGSLRILLDLSGDQNLPPPPGTRFPGGINLHCPAANLAVAPVWMPWRAEFAKLVQI